MGLLGAGELYVGSEESAERRVEADSPTGLLPLLERPYAVVAAEIQAWDAQHELSQGSLAQRLPLEAVVRHASASASEYWAGLALDWIVAMPPVVDIGEALAALEVAAWAPQKLRHRARRIRRGVTGARTDR